MQNFVIISLIVMVMLCGCVSERTVTIDKAHAELLAFWDSLDSLTALFEAFGALQFEYRNELNDINFYFDKPPAPEVTQARQWANCTGYAEYVAQFIKYKRNCDSYKKMLLLQRGTLGFPVKWHYCLIVRSGNVLFMTSNNQLSILENEEQFATYWIGQGYTSIQSIEEWQK